MAKVHSFDEWYELGREMGWVSSMFCAVHDPPPITADEELQILENDWDSVCIATVRLYEGAITIDWSDWVN